MAYKNVKFIDQENITFAINGQVIQVFDQNDELVGEKTLPCTVPEDYTYEEIQSFVKSKGIDIEDVLQEIIRISVISKQEYELWIGKTSAIYYSHSMKSWTAETISPDTFFGKTIEILRKGESEEKEKQKEVAIERFKFGIQKEEKPVTKEEVCDKELEKEIITEEIDLIINKLEKTESPPSDLDIEKETTKSQDLEDFNILDKQNETLCVEKQLVEKEEVLVVKLDENTKKEIFVNVEEKKEMVITDKDIRLKLKNWSKAYSEILVSEKKVQDVTISELCDEVEKIVEEMCDKQDIFEIDEKEVLYQLVQRKDIVFSTLQTLNAGFFQAYTNIEK